MTTEEKEDIEFIKANLPLEKRRSAAKFYLLKSNIAPTKLTSGFLASQCSRIYAFSLESCLLIG